jgi:hypothetical protein
VSPLGGGRPRRGAAGASYFARRLNARMASVAASGSTKVGMVHPQPQHDARRFTTIVWGRGAIPDETTSRSLFALAMTRPPRVRHLSGSAQGRRPTKSGEGRFALGGALEGVPIGECVLLSEPQQEVRGASAEVPQEVTSDLQREHVPVLRARPQLYRRMLRACGVRASAPCALVRCGRHRGKAHTESSDPARPHAIGRLGDPPDRATRGRTVVGTPPGRTVKAARRLPIRMV